MPYSDVLIFATGYTRDYSIFDGATANRLMATNSGLHLYRSIVSPHVPGLYFIGSEVRHTRSYDRYSHPAWLACCFAIGGRP